MNLHWYMLHLSTRNTAINLLVFLFPFRLFFLRLSLSFHTDVLTTSATVGHSTRNHTATPANTVAATILSVLPRHATDNPCSFTARHGELDMTEGHTGEISSRAWWRGMALLGTKVRCPFTLHACPVRCRYRRNDDRG